MSSALRTGRRLRATVLAFGAAASLAALPAALNPSAAHAFAGCKYKGVSYDEGKTVTQDDGKTYICQNGSWILDNKSNVVLVDDVWS